ncbi:MAG: hypothetical protein ACOX9E_06720 [Lentisphaeria bacterium]|jgi:hypothetical protein
MPWRPVLPLRGNFLSHAQARRFFIRRFRRLAQIMAACLAACAAIHAAGFLQIGADFRRLVCVSRAGAKVFYPQIPQISADYGGLSCRLRGNSRRRVFADRGRFSQIGVCLTRRCEDFFIRRFRRFSQIMAACLAAGFLQIGADFRRLVCVSRAGAKVFYPQIPQIFADYGGLSCRLRGNSRRRFFADWG